MGSPGNGQVLPWPSRQRLSRPGFRPARLSLLTQPSKGRLHLVADPFPARHPCAVRGEIFSSPFSTFNFYWLSHCTTRSILQASETPHSEKQWLCRAQLGGKNNTLECYGGML
ncbi:MAG: hypothetical protein DMG51_06935 [Acidobacteria bacterium]|nr:MAG: hypothetical protein DMG51_06935 [Acidobacteriota bacterium]